MTDYEEKSAGCPAKYRGLPALPAGREKAALQDWEEKTITELAKQGLGDAVTAVSLDYEAMANTRLGDKVQKVFGLLLCPSEGPLRAEPDLLEMLREKCGSSPALRLHGARLFALMAHGVRVLPEPEEVAEARRIALRNLLHGGLTPSTTGKEVSAHLRKVKRAMADVPEEAFTPEQWRAYLRRIVPPGSHARQRRAWDLELQKLDAEALTPLEGSVLTMAFIRWWNTESNASALHDALPPIGGSGGAKQESSADNTLITNLLTSMREEKRRRAAAAVADAEEELMPSLVDDDAMATPCAEEGADDLLEYIDMEPATLSANKATVCMCDFCGFVHVGGDQPDEYCWGKKDVVRDPGAEERLRKRDPERLAFLDELRERDRAGLAGKGVCATGAPRSRPTGAASARGSAVSGAGSRSSSTRAPTGNARGLSTRTSSAANARAGESRSGKASGGQRVAMRAEDLAELQDRLRTALLAQEASNANDGQEDTRKEVRSAVRLCLMASRADPDDEQDQDAEVDEQGSEPAEERFFGIEKLLMSERLSDAQKVLLVQRLEAAHTVQSQSSARQFRRGGPSRWEPAAGGQIGAGAAIEGAAPSPFGPPPTGATVSSWLQGTGLHVAADVTQSAGGVRQIGGAMPAPKSVARSAERGASFADGAMPSVKVESGAQGEPQVKQEAVPATDFVSNRGESDGLSNDQVSEIGDVLRELADRQAKGNNNLDEVAASLQKLEQLFTGMYATSLTNMRGDVAELKLWQARLHTSGTEQCESMRMLHEKLGHMQHVIDGRHKEVVGLTKLGEVQQRTGAAVEAALQRVAERMADFQGTISNELQGGLSDVSHAVQSLGSRIERLEKGDPAPGRGDAGETTQAAQVGGSLSGYEPMAAGADRGVGGPVANAEAAVAGRRLAPRNLVQDFENSVEATDRSSPDAAPPRPPSPPQHHVRGGDAKASHTGAPSAAHAVGGATGADPRPGPGACLGGVGGRGSKGGGDANAVTVVDPIEPCALAGPPEMPTNGSSARCADDSLTTLPGNGALAGDASRPCATPSVVEELTSESVLQTTGGGTAAKGESCARGEGEGKIVEELRAELARRNRQLESEVALREAAQVRASADAAQSAEVREALRRSMEEQRVAYERELERHVQAARAKQEQWQAEQAQEIAAQADRERAEAKAVADAAKAADQREELERILKAEREERAQEKMQLEDEVARAQLCAVQQDSAIAATLGQGEEKAEMSGVDSEVDRELARAMADAESASQGLGPRQTEEVQEQLLQGQNATMQGEPPGEPQSDVQANPSGESQTASASGTPTAGEASLTPARLTRPPPGIEMLRTICRKHGDASKYFEMRREALGVIFYLRRLEKYMQVAPRGMVYDRAVQIVGSMSVVECCLAEMLARPREADQWVAGAIPAKCRSKCFVPKIKGKVDTVNSMAWSRRVGDWHLPALEMPSAGKLPAPDVTCEEEFPAVEASKVSTKGKVSARDGIQMTGGKQGKPKGESLSGKMASRAEQDSLMPSEESEQPRHVHVLDEPRSVMLHLIVGEMAAYQRDDGSWVGCVVTGVHYVGVGEPPIYDVLVDGETSDRRSEHTRLDYYARIGRATETHLEQFVENQYAAYHDPSTDRWVACRIKKIHYDEEESYYTIIVDGQERNTVGSRLDDYSRVVKGGVGGPSKVQPPLSPTEEDATPTAPTSVQAPSSSRTGARKKKAKKKTGWSCSCDKCSTVASCDSCEQGTGAAPADTVATSVWPDLVVSSQEELNAAIAARRHIVHDDQGDIIGRRKVVLRAGAQTRVRCWAARAWDGWTMGVAHVAQWAGPALVMLVLTAVAAAAAVSAASLGAVSVHAAANAVSGLAVTPVGSSLAVAGPSVTRVAVGADPPMNESVCCPTWADCSGKLPDRPVRGNLATCGDDHASGSTMAVSTDAARAEEQRDAGWAVIVSLAVLRMLCQLCQLVVEAAVVGEWLGGASATAWRTLWWVCCHLNPVRVGLAALQAGSDTACLVGCVWMWCSARLSARLRAVRLQPNGTRWLWLVAAVGLAGMASCGDVRRLDGSWSDVAEGVSRAKGAIALHGEVNVHVASIGSAELAACSAGSYGTVDAWQWSADDRALRACVGAGALDDVGPSTRQQWVQQRLDVGAIDEQVAKKLGWCMLDSGCSGVYCAPGTLLQNREKCVPGRSKDQVHTANMIVEPLSKGTWEVLWLESGGEWQTIAFKDAWEMPGFTSPLVSVGRMIEEANCEVVFSKVDGQCRVEVEGLTFPFPRCRKGVYTYNMPYLAQENRCLLEETPRAEAGAAATAGEQERAEFAGRHAAAAVRKTGADKTGADRPPEFSGQHVARGAGMSAINGMGLPAQMRKASWFAHLTFSHACGKRVADAAKHAMTHLPPVSASEMCDCEACTEANACKIHSNRHAAEPAEWGHFVADECGPLPESWDGYRWALVMQEMKTGYVFFVPMKTKGDTAKALAGVQRIIARLPGKKAILSLRFDGDGSHRSEKVKSWALMDDVHLIMTRPYESNSNATAERCVHSIFCGIRANCVQAELDEGAWALAGMHTAQCYNMLGNAKTGPQSSPFLETFGYKPRGDNMRPFGSLMIVSNMSDTKGRPTQPTGERGIYVGTFDEFNSPDIDQVVGRSTCFAIKVGRRNQLLYRANAKCFPTVFPGLPLSKASHPLRQVGPREDESEVHGVGARGGTRSRRRAADVNPGGAGSAGAPVGGEDPVDDARCDADVGGGVDDQIEGTREEGVTRRALKNKSEKLCVGDRRLVPATVWPEYDCQEYEGAGWEVELLSYKNGYWKVRFVSARWPNGEKYADEELKRRLLHPLPTDGANETPKALASQWRAGLAEQAEDPLDDASELWSAEQGAIGLEADAELLTAMNVAARESQEESMSAMSVEVGANGPMPIGKALLLPNGEGAKVRQALDAELSTVIDDFNCLTPVLRGAPETEGYKEFHLGAHAIHKAADSLKAARWKVRLFFNGSEEEKFVDYDDCSSPVKRSSAFRLMCGIAACNDASPSGKWLLEHSDQTGAFMHEDNEPVLARMPKALREYRVVDGTRREVLYWVRNLYGRHDAGRKFVIGHRQWFLERNFTACTAEPCLFVRRDERGVAIVGVYVDDCAWLCSSKEMLEELKKEYCESYRAQFGELTSFLGIRVARDAEHGTVSTDLEHQIESLASKWLAGGDGLKVTPSRPCDEKLLQLVSPMALEANPPPPEELRKRYMRLVGLLMYIAVTERFDVLYPVGLLARAPHRCTEELFERGLCVAAYLFGTKHYKTCYNGAAGVRLEACSDASHEEWGATSGNVAYVAGAAISGMSKRQRCKTLSTCESETVAASVCAAEVVSHRMTLEELGYEQTTPTAIYVDNIALAYLCRNTTLSNALKHVRRRFFFVKDVAEIGEIVVSWIDGKNNEADALTKALPEPRFRELTAMFRGRQPRMLRALMAGLRRLGWKRSEAAP